MFALQLQETYTKSYQEKSRSGMEHRIDIRTKNNQIFAGVNMENASYPQGICAEGTALGQMISAGEREIAEIVICSQGNTLCFPCGGCRQLLSEFSNENTVVHICHAKNDSLHTTNMGTLLPHSFSKLNMED